VLLAKLTFVDYEHPIDTAQDILASKMPVVVGQFTAPQFLVRDSPFPEIRKV
jgi:hypothetical protein